MIEKLILNIVTLSFICSLGMSQTTPKQKRIIPSSFPSDYVVTDHCPSCETPDTLIFYPDRTYIHVLGGIGNSEKHYELGVWRIDEDIIKMDMHKIIGLRPIGKPINPDCQYASNPRDYCKYDDYVPFERWIEETKTFDPMILEYDDEVLLIKSVRASQIRIDSKDFLLHGKYKVASCRQLKKADLEHLSKSELRLMRNEIFARYGYKFNSSSLQEHFGSQDWYNGFTRNVDDFLTDIEKKNINLIREFEQK